MFNYKFLVLFITPFVIKAIPSLAPPDPYYPSLLYIVAFARNDNLDGDVYRIFVSITQISSSFPLTLFRLVLAQRRWVKVRQSSRRHRRGTSGTPGGTPRYSLVTPLISTVSFAKIKYHHPLQRKILQCCYITV